jgi:membrane protein implicated in regulation of membrane protease activity
MAELTELLNNLEFWHWWVLAAALVAVEVFAPSTVFLWPGVAAAVVGLVLLVADDIGWQVQVLLFAALSVISLGIWLGFVRSRLARPAESMLNRRGVQYIGREFVLAQPIVDRQGTLNIDDTTWHIAGEDQDAGKRVRVVSMDGAVLNVEAA